MNEAQIRKFLARLGEAVSAGDLARIVSCWEVPVLILSDERVMAVSDPGEIERFFAQARDWYRSRGLVATKPELERVDPLSDKLAAVDVRWPAFDEAGVEKASERSHYILRRGDDGEPRIRVALTRTV